VLAAAAVIALRASGALQPLELVGYDAFVRAQAPGLLSTYAERARVALVVATEADLEKLDFPIEDGVLADLLERILAQKPRAVGVDIYRDRARPPGSERLEKLLAAHDNVFMVFKFEEPGHKRAVPPPAALAGKPERVGFADNVEDSDGVVRKGLLYLDDGKTNFTSLNGRVALAWLAADGIRPRADGDLLSIGKTRLLPLEANDGPYVDADAGGYQFLLDFAGGRSPFSSWRFEDVLAGKLPPDALADRAVLVGVTAESVKDFFATPYREGKGAVEPLFGVALHAHAASQLIRMAKGEAAPMRLPGRAADSAWIALWCLAGAAAGTRLRRLHWYALGALAGLLLLLGIAYVAFGARLWLPVVPAAIGFLASAGLITAWLTRRESAQRALLMDIFSRYVATPVAAEIWERRAELVEGGRLKPRRIAATVLFSDIKGFTPISEKLDAAGLMDWLSEYLDRMAALVHRHGGVVDKYIGDAVMGVFGLYGDPKDPERSAKLSAGAAIECALAMRAELEILNRGWSERGLPPIGIRVGVHTGPLVHGTLGGQRLESTVIGDTVNIASRLESYDKDVVDPEDPDAPCRILVTSDTLGPWQASYRSWLVGEVRLKGRDEPVRVYGIRGPS
jgi:adenylate cyclase